MIKLMHCEICNELYKPTEGEEECICPNCRGMGDLTEIPQYIKELVETLQES